MADNTCHFGVNNMFADNGLSDVHSFLYFPADPAQMIAIIQRVFLSAVCVSYSRLGPRCPGS